MGIADGDSPRFFWSPDGDCPPVPRPSLGFMLDDEEMLGRLVHLCGSDRVEAMERVWEILREHGRGDQVDREKERYCRRMYNLSQFVKTLKERISMWYNDTYKHTGNLWEGRFYSGVVEKDAVVKTIVSAYIGYNPVKAKLVVSPAEWKWSSYALAVSGKGEHSCYCRRMYELMLGCPWEEVRMKLESAYADKLPDSITPEALKKMLDDYDDEDEKCGEGVRPLRAVCANEAIERTL